MVQAVRGMRDILPADARRWRLVEDSVEEIMHGFAYEEIQLPLLESSELFARGVGEATDIVEKEMYTLADRDGDSLSLRPEGTASCVRALQENGLLYNQTPDLCSVMKNRKKVAIVNFIRWVLKPMGLKAQISMPS